MKFGTESFVRRLGALIVGAVSAGALAVVAGVTPASADTQVCSSPVADPGPGFTLEECIVSGDVAVAGITKLFYSDGLPAGGQLAVTVTRDGRPVGTDCAIPARSGNGVFQCVRDVARLAGLHTYQAFGLDSVTGIRVQTPPVQA